MKRIYLGTMEAAQAVGNEVAIRRQQFELRMDAERAKAFSEAIDKAKTGQGRGRAGRGHAKAKKPATPRTKAPKKPAKAKGKFAATSRSHMRGRSGR